MNRKQVFRSIMILLGGFVVAYNLTIALHEFGHTVTVLIGGGQVQQFVLNPFSWSWNLGKNIPDIRFTAWGGVTFGLAFTLIPLIFLRFSRSASLKLMIKLLAASGLLINGIYLLAGVLFRFGDGGELAQLGVGSAWIMALGTLYLLLSLRIWSDLQFHLNLDASTPLRHRAGIMLAGIGPYMLAIFIFNLVFNPGQMAIWGGFAAAGIALAGVISLAGHTHARLRANTETSTEKTAGSPIPLLAAGGLIILAEFLVFGTPMNPF